MKNGLLLSAALAVLAGTAQAAVIGGAVTSGSALTQGGIFIELDPTSDPTLTNPLLGVGDDTFQTPHLYAFDEDQNISIGSTISVDVGTDPIAGDIVASHYVFFDPAGATTQIGYVDFDADIYGIATSTGTLAASDFLANTGVTYKNPTLRGLEGGDSVWIDAGNARRLWVDWYASTPGDYVRVFTMESPEYSAVPLPASGFLLAGAGLGLMALRRRKAAR